MNKCNACTLKPGEQAYYTGPGWCVGCNSEWEFCNEPLHYIGYEFDVNKGYKAHLFSLDSAFVCPGCHKIVNVISSDCRNEGYGLDMPIVLELPVQETKDEEDVITVDDGNSSNRTA